MASEPPWFLGMMWSTSRALWLLLSPAALAAAPGPCEHPVFHRTADRRAVAGSVRVAAGFCIAVHVLTPLRQEGIQPQAAQLQQFVALAVAQFLGADQPVVALLQLRDAVAVEHPAHHPLDALRVVIDLGHVLAQDPPGDVLRWGWAGCCLAIRGPATP